MPFVERFRAVLHIGNSPFPKFDFRSNKKWLDMGNEGYQTEGFVGHYTCPTKSCHAKILAYRSVEMTATVTNDYLRFEQPVAGGSGRIVIEVPITFESEFVAMESTRVLQRKKVISTPCTCEVVREKFFASCKCVSCGKTLNFYNQVKRCKEVGKLRWFLARKEDKVLEGVEVLLGGLEGGDEKVAV
ncbi:uncharacterized protein L3040_002127 [Drepanopeziza brunnea f. sp. 'multigermtubi']|uniref:Uncharacterized protein n=1 Tax=Marssonina brunnea f. sp. multigermtubi (strain MB_m1) TaxID=1072389 RepID=K1WLY7_MARBU|nr:uncharacterized protein MBM_02942 [Drepanopeziza brunnea f. sp. 'multigermtubi' MB_m1]EKD18700.1 hypothetical protein MBM_02942 [Drepanopeziza brunnea f. sp. 'multigermtubi' MB_m1]KAJ5052376.1 hypothetical protein L3040_002127 [Drepanopeziza brunnea f. sp. 'multigermtubi']